MPTLTAAHTTREELIQIAHEVLPVLRKNAAEVDATGVIPAENLETLRDAGLLALLRPTEYDGAEVDLRTSLEVQVVLAQGCGSTSWVAGLGNVSSFLLALFSRQAQDDVWGANPGARLAVVTSPAESRAEVVDGGWKINGRWRYASGSAYAQWIVVGVPLENEGVPDIGLALLPREDVVLENSWHVAGMRGTASDTVVVDDLFVPTHRQTFLNAAYAGEARGPYFDKPGTIYRTPFAPVFSLCLAASPVGLAKEAVRLGAEHAAKRKIPYQNIFQSEDPTIQNLFGNAAIAVDSAEMHLLRAADEADLAATEGRQFTAFETQRRSANSVAAVRYSTEAVRDITRALMSSSFVDTNPIQRIWRDCEMASSHLGFAEMNVTRFGKMILEGTA